MKVMVIGGGGREHAIVKKLKESAKVSELYVLPGNGGMAADAKLVDISADDIGAIVDFAVNSGIDYAVVTPDDPLVAGTVDALNEKGIPCFGPRRDAAMLEGSKAFAKGFMRRHGIPTAAYEVFDSEAEALTYVAAAPLPTVIKADGLALGKGVTIAETHEAAAEAVREAMSGRKFGDSGSRLVIEQFLTGPEVSVLCFTDGKMIKPMVSGMDHKRARDGDIGPNTGGMGAIAPNPYYTADIAAECMEKIFLPTIRGMAEEGRPFTGCLYFGLMLTPDGPKVIEYNCRFGDPETQAVLPLLQSDLMDIMLATTNGTLAETPVEFSNDSCCCVVMASDGYPVKYEKGFKLSIAPEVEPYVYVAGAKLADGELLTNGGRVIGVTAVGATLAEAVKTAYERTEKVSFVNAYYRRDIGGRALAKE
ncbi:MAG: phosphoribosylamine--glycine ligase [Oscillospiraceae bacterium]|nr:phosphoribosylamine--glycine ligase [Oscillospiraceae bacterium]